LARRDAKVLIVLRELQLPPKYSDWRLDSLSLEQRLALARDDNRPITARRLEIEILERDATIDEETALHLRKNLLAHFTDSPSEPSEPLQQLPHLIEFDEPAALKAARLQCPLFDCLSPDEQLRYLEEDLRMAEQDAETKRQRADALARSQPRSKEWADAECFARLAELRDYQRKEMQREIEALKEKIES
jgi:hypothetical protein